MLPMILTICGLGAPCDMKHWEHRLGSDSFKVRQRASVQLLRRNDLRLCRWLKASNDPEVAMRARMVTEQIRERYLRNMEPYPCIDSLFYCNSGGGFYGGYVVNNAATEFMYYHGVGPWPYGNSGPNWQSYRLASRHWAGELIDNGVPISAIRSVLLEMHRRDKLAGFAYKPIKKGK